MPVTNGTVTAPISITEVSNLLDAGTNDLGTLCKSECINRWARYKPLRSSELSSLTDAARKAKNWGYWIPEKTTAAKIAAWICGGNMPSEWAMPSNGRAVDGNGVWLYVPPTGGASSPYRIADYEGYNHNTAHNTFLTGGVRLRGQQVALPLSNVLEFVSGYGETRFFINNNLYSSTDFSRLENGYFGIIVAKKSSPSNFKVITANVVLGSGTDASNCVVIAESSADLLTLFGTQDAEYVSAYIISDTPKALSDVPRDTEFTLLPFDSFRCKRVLGYATADMISGYAYRASAKVIELSVTLKNNGVIPASSPRLIIDWGDSSSSTVYAGSDIDVGGTKIIEATHSYTIKTSAIRSISFSIQWNDSRGTQTVSGKSVEVTDVLPRD